MTLLVFKHKVPTGIIEFTAYFCWMVTNCVDFKVGLRNVVIF